MTFDRLSRRAVSSLGLVAVTMVLPHAGGSGWPMVGYNPAHTGYNNTETTIGLGTVSGLHEVWTDVTPDEIVSAPSIAGGVAFVGSLDNKLYAFSATGTTGCSGTPKKCAPLWSTPRLGGDITSTPAVANGTVYVGSVGEKVVAFDAAGVKNCTGAPKVCRPLWSRATSGDVIASPTVAHGVVYVIAAHDVSDELDAIAGTSGGLKWRAILDTDLSIPEHSASAVTIANGLVYAGFSASGSDIAMVAAFDANGVKGCNRAVAYVQAAVDGSARRLDSSTYACVCERLSIRQPFLRTERVRLSGRKRLCGNAENVFAALVRRRAICNAGGREWNRVRRQCCVRCARKDRLSGRTEDLSAVVDQRER